MEVLRELPSQPLGGGHVVTAGTFDGVHLGHRALLARGRQEADERGLPYAVVTFDPPPRTVLYPASAPDLLNTMEEKLELLRVERVEVVVVAHFNRALAQLPAADFMTRIDTAFEVAALVVGHDHGLGRGREGDVAFLRRWGDLHGYPVEVVEAASVGGEVVSSSAIRTALLAGDLDRANLQLGHPYSLSGRVQRGHGVGRSLGFPTANISPPPGKLVPAEGVYLVAFQALASAGHGLLSIGRRPTFGDFRLSVEVYLFDWERDLYNQEVTLELLRYLRPEVAFSSVDDLIRQMRADELQGRALLQVAS